MNINETSHSMHSAVSKDGDIINIDSNMKTIREEINIKSEPGDTSEYEGHELENTAVSNTGVNINKGCDMPPDDSTDSDIIKEEIYIKTEYEFTDEYVQTAGEEHTDGWKNGINDGDIVYQDNSNTDMISIKFEPVDISEYEEDEVESAAVANTEDCDSQKTYCISSTDDMSQYNYNTNIIITEEIDIKFECCDVDEYKEGAAEQNTGDATTSSNLNESWAPMSVNKFETNNATETGFKHVIYEKSFAQAQDLATHKPIHISQKRFKCDQCIKSFSFKSQLIIHKRSHSGEKPFKCDQCDTVFSLSSQLIRHKRTHSGEKPFKCNQCNTSFSISSNLSRHKLIHSGEKSFQCEQCNKTFSILSNLIRHKRIHSGEKPYKCDQCDKSFSNSSDLLVHKRVHSGERPYKCEHCDKAFACSAPLVIHRRTHSGEKPFKCDLCDKAFSCSAHLISHKRSHSTEKFKCDQCNKSFSHLSSVNVHKRVHSGEKPYKCELCNETYPYLSSLNRHKRIHVKHEQVI